MPERDLTVITDAAHAAGEIAMRHFRSNPEKWDKGDGQGPVTEADIAIDRMLHESLLFARPEYGWLSEETEDDTARLHKPRVFIVDPIDGTRAFIAGDTSFATAIAVAEAGEVIAGVIHLPAMGLTYSASKNGGAFLNGEPIHPSVTRELAQARILGTRPLMEPWHWVNGRPDFKQFFRPSLAYRMCLAADGNFDGMATLRPAWEWDIAAGDIIMREAGGLVTTRENLPAVFNSPDPRLNGVIAAPDAIHRQILANLRSVD